MFLALREMRRAKVRFGLLTAAVGLLVFLILFQQAISSGLITQFIGALRNLDAPVLVYSDQARRSIEGGVVTPETLDAVRAVDGVADVAPLGEGTFTVTAAGELKDATLFGYTLGGLGAPTTLEKGRLPQQDGEAVGSVVDAGKGFGIGDSVRIEPGGGTITIVGLARDINYSVTPTLFVSFETYRQARLIRNPDAKDVYPTVGLVRPADGVSASDLVERIDTAVDGVEPLTRSDAAAKSPGVAQVTQSFNIVLSLYGFVVPFVTGLFFLIVTFQKANALVLLRAIGAEAGKLVGALMVQVLFVVLVGVAIGIGLLFPITRGDTGGIPIPFSGTAIAFWALLLLVFSLVSALFSVRRVLAIDPIEATTGAGVGR